jgi:UDP-N-acetylglucosamine--N-acetylmuramyl-(pentapeptide) pyrophosphoryl-undecaprenol N-acetylglucosamine transferase
MGLQVKTLLVAGGGTGGHVFPALAVTKNWLRRGEVLGEEREAVFVGTERGLENKLVPPTGIPLEKIRSAGLKGMGGLKLVGRIAMLGPALLDSAAILRRHKFTAAFGVGGYAAGPVLLLAALKRIPVVIFEPNAAPGFTNRMLARFATRIATGYEETARAWGPKAVVTGCPIRDEFQFVPPRQPEPPFRILITGGSQGARPINRAVKEALPLLSMQKDKLMIVHQTGEREYDDVRAVYAQYAFNALVRPFIPDMPERMAWADLIISRAGQTTIAEIAAIGRAALFIPFGGAADNHQLRNAQALERDGAARVLVEENLNGARLAQEILNLLARPDELVELAGRAHKFARPDATDEIVNLIEQVARP